MTEVPPAVILTVLLNLALWPGWILLVDMMHERKVARRRAAMPKTFIHNGVTYVYLDSLEPR